MIKHSIKNFLIIGLLSTLALSLTGCRKKRCCASQDMVVVERTERISGPLADTDVVWTEADYK